MSPPVAANLAELIDRVYALVAAAPGRVLLGVAGSPGAGKSTLVEVLLARLRPAPPPGLPADDWVAHVPMDGFHLADVELDRLGRHDRKGAPDTFDGAGYAALLARLAAPPLAETGEVVYAPGFERELEQPLAGAIPVPPAARLVFTEGNYLLLPTPPWPRVRDQLTEVWFCEAAEDRRLTQLIARHTEFGKPLAAARGWVARSDQRNAELVAATRGNADLVVPEAVLADLKRATS